MQTLPHERGSVVPGGSRGHGLSVTKEIQSALLAAAVFSPRSVALSLQIYITCRRGQVNQAKMTPQRPPENKLHDEELFSTVVLMINY